MNIINQKWKQVIKNKNQLNFVDLLFFIDYNKFCIIPR